MPVPRAVCSANVFPFSFIIFSDPTFHPIISGSTGAIFTKFSPYDRYLTVYYWSDLFPDRSRDVAMATNFTENGSHIYTWVKSFFGIQSSSSALIITSRRQIRSLWNFVWARLKLVGPFNHICPVTPHSQIALPVSATQLQWPRLPGPRCSRPIGLVWDITVHYG